jgi:DNA-binding transcriptional ArsR family regulator
MGKKRKRKHGTVSAEGGPLDDVLAKALSHPMRAEILSYLSDHQIASPVEMDRAGLGRTGKAGRERPPQKDTNNKRKLSNISYHVRILEGMGLIKVVDTRQVRGSTEHFYEAVTKMLLDYEDWKKLPKGTQARISISAIQETIDRASKALTAGTIDSYDERNIINLGLRLDEDRFKQASYRMHEMMEWLQDLHREAVAEVGGEEARLIPVTASLLLYESPPPKKAEL